MWVAYLLAFVSLFVYSDALTARFFVARPAAVIPSNMLATPGAFARASTAAVHAPGCACAVCPKPPCTIASGACVCPLHANA